MNDHELHEYFENMVRTLRSKGVLCAITSGLACVHYGIAESTQDCDLLCHTSSFPVLLDYLSETAIDGQPCQYRGNISPPLDARWHKGGWTSHFEWDLGVGKVRLDVFGSALRESTPWSDDLHGFYAGMQVVAESKLDPNPLRTYGIDRYLKEARENTVQFVNPRMVEYLPDLADHFHTLKQ